MQDLIALKAQLKASAFSFNEKDYRISESDDWQDLFLMGTEVTGSCQNVNADPGLNKSLIGYLMNGRNKLIVIKQRESEKIEGRALIRLFLDD